MKARIQDKAGIPAEQQRLVFAGRDLDDSYTMASYGVEFGQTVLLVMLNINRAGR